MNEAMRASLYKGDTLEMDWEQVRRFHGHLGPWLAVGARMGQEAMRRLGTRPHFGVTVEVRCRLEPPVSCLLDGLQWMTGATYGKRNITAEESEDVSVRVTRDDDGASVLIKPVAGVPEAMRRWIDEMGVEEASQHAYGLPAEQLYTVQEMSP